MEAIVSLAPRPRTNRIPHNKSERARDAEARGERTWTGWRLTDLVDQVLRVNTRGLEAKDLRDVKNLEFLKVKLLASTENHHTGLRMPEPVTRKQDQYFGLNTKVAAKLNSREVAKWRARLPTDQELDEAVRNRTGRYYYRETRR